MQDHITETVIVRHLAFSKSSFSDVCEWMKTQDPHAPLWMIEAVATIKFDTIEINYVVHFSHDARTVIYSSGSSGVRAGDRSSGVRAGDQKAVRILSNWLIDNGWKRPEPSHSEADSSRDFWKELWITGVVDSMYLQSRFGKRRIFDEE